MATLTLLQPGLLTSVQDLGRPGHAALGVAVSGAADTLSLVVANRLVGNPDGAAALEWTLTGGSLRADADVTLAVAGAPMPALVEPSGAAPRPLRPGAPFVLAAGDVLRLGAPAWGVRTYLAVAGGLDVATALGSASTHLPSALGGHQGRALRAGDRLPLGRTRGAPRAGLDAATLEGLAARLRRPRLRALPGSHAEAFDVGAREAFWRGRFTVSSRSDRTGVRLSGPAVPPAGSGSLLTEGLPLGAVEVPGPGEAIVLGVDGPPTGGYAVLACIAAVDLPRLGQARPQESLGLEPVTPQQAREAWERERRWLDAALPPAGAAP